MSGRVFFGATTGSLTLVQFSDFQFRHLIHGLSRTPNTTVSFEWPPKRKKNQNKASSLKKQFCLCVPTTQYVLAIARQGSSSERRFLVCWCLLTHLICIVEQESNPGQQKQKRKRREKKTTWTLKLEIELSPFHYFVSFQFSILSILSLSLLTPQCSFLLCPKLSLWFWISLILYRISRCLQFTSLFLFFYRTEKNTRPFLWNCSDSVLQKKWKKAEFFSMEKSQKLGQSNFQSKLLSLSLSLFGLLYYSVLLRKREKNSFKAVKTEQVPEKPHFRQVWCWDIWGWTQNDSQTRTTKPTY